MPTPLTCRQLALRAIELLIQPETPQPVQQWAIDYLLGLATRADEAGQALAILGVKPEGSTDD